MKWFPVVVIISVVVIFVVNDVVVGMDSRKATL